MTFLAAPDERVRLDVIERPTDRSAVGIYATKHNTITYRPSLNSHDVVELRTYEDYAPLFKSSIEKADRGPHAMGWVISSGLASAMRAAGIQDARRMRARHCEICGWTYRLLP